MELDNQLKAFEINCDSFLEKKNGMNYLSWSVAWGEFKKVHPKATYNIKKNSDGIPLFGNPDIGYMVFTDVTVDEVTHEMWLHIMDFKNNAMKNPDMKNINKTVMRCLTKNLAMFGLGINVYQGEDFPDENDVDGEPKNKSNKNTEDKASEKQIKMIKATINKASNKDEWLKWIRETYVVEIEDLSKKEASEVIKQLKGE